MTTLSLAARNELARIPELTSLLGQSVSWDTWIFDTKPVKVAVEGTSRCMIVVNQGTAHAGANDHNTLRFPRLLVDIWADPTRDTTKQSKPVKVDDAQTKIEAIARIVDRVFHRVDSGTSAGNVLIWGTAEQVAAKTGVIISGSKRIDGDVDYSQVKDSDGTWMGRLTYAVNML